MLCSTCDQPVNFYQAYKVLQLKKDVHWKAEDPAVFCNSVCYICKTYSQLTEKDKRREMFDKYVSSDSRVEALFPEGFSSFKVMDPMIVRRGKDARLSKTKS